MTEFSDAHLETLEKTLDDLPQDGLPMSLSELNGFLTGIILNPQHIMASHWIPKIWGDRHNQTRDALKDIGPTINLIMEHYNLIVRMLAEDGHFEAVLAYDIDNPDETLWEPWVAGFMKSIDLVPGSWDVLTVELDEEAHASLDFLFTLEDACHNTSEVSDKQLDDIDKYAPELIPSVVAELNRFTKDLRSNVVPMQVDAVPETYTDNILPFAGRRQGGDERCKCGSGRKYKLCCGSH
jgi:uncharacterized protein